MSLENLTSAKLGGLIALVEKREALQKELAKIENAIQTALGAVGSSRATRPKAGRPAAKKQNGKRGRRGALKEAILTELKAAGGKGLSAKELSAKLGVKNQNIHVWFSSTGKTVKGLKKNKEGAWIYSE